VISKTLKKKDWFHYFGLNTSERRGRARRPGWWEERVRCGEGEEPAKTGPKNIRWDGEVDSLL